VTTVHLSEDGLMEFSNKKLPTVQIEITGAVAILKTITETLESGVPKAKAGN
jgi:hypothetical protein